VPAIQRRQVSEFVAARLGLHFPQERWSDLQLGLASAAAEFGVEDVVACTDWLLSAPLDQAQLQTLASHLTIGETYFFRETRTLEALAQRVLPDLVQSRRGRQQRLRLWSAGCCTGEEAYSLAILLRQLIPDLAGWEVTMLATDINPHFLRKAVAGSYGEWSFRGVPVGFRERYFQRTGGGHYVVAPKIRAMVAVEYSNLVEDGRLSVATDTNAMDRILCRNVLMYFTSGQARKAISMLHHARLDGGWLAVSPCGVSASSFCQFATRSYPGATLYQKGAADLSGSPWPQREADVAGVAGTGSPGPAGCTSECCASSAGGAPAAVAAPHVSQTSVPEALPEAPLPGLPPPTPYAAALSFYERGCYAEVALVLLALAAGPAFTPAACSLLARALANQGKLAEALTWCDRLVAADKLDAAGHYLRAVVLLEQGDPAQARRALQRAVYLRPDLVLAHFVLGNIERNGGRRGEADRHFANALHLLARLRPGAFLPESEGVTVARLRETIMALTAVESCA
jgi:chemotaxis protein methyltransferase CheR